MLVARRCGSSCGRARRSPPTASSSRGARAVDASMVTGEPVPVEVEPRRRGDRRDGERQRVARRGSHPGRGRHGTRPDHPPGRRSAGQPRRGAAARRPRRRGLRSRSDHHRRRHPRRMARRHRGRRRRRVHRSSGRADHRLPVRPRARDTARHHGGNGTGQPSSGSSSRVARCSRTPAAVDAIVVDKTGTVTEAAHVRSVDVRAPGGDARPTLLPFGWPPSPRPPRRRSEHPIARAIVEAAPSDARSRRRRRRVPQPAGFWASTALVDGVEVRVGRRGVVRHGRAGSGRGRPPRAAEVGWQHPRARRSRRRGGGARVRGRRRPS